MICKKCGTSNQDDFNFCCMCGSKLEIQEELNTETKNNTEPSMPFLRKIPGFRSNTPWKMLVATLMYTLIIIYLIIPKDSAQKTSEQSSPFVMYQQIEALFQNGDTERAKTVFNDMSSKYPNAPETAKAKRMVAGDNELTPHEKEEKAREDQRKAEEEKKRKEEVEIKQKAYEESIKPPLELVEAMVTLNVISNPQVSVIVKNISNKTVDAYTFGIYCYDRFGNEVRHYGYERNNRYGALCQRTISAGNSTGSNYYWTLHGHENTAKIDVVLEKVHFTDDTSWTPQSNQRVSVKGVLEQ